MEKFQHHPDGIITVEKEGLKYTDTVANFEQDLASLELSPYPGVPKGAEIYEPDGIQSSFIDGDQRALTLDPDLLDRYIFAIDDLISAKAAREVPPDIPPVPPEPDVPGFVDGIKEALGGIVAANVIARMYPLFYSSLQAGNFADVEALILDADSTGVLSKPQYAAFKELAITHRIPVTLP